MNEQEILLLISQGENQTTEFKREEENNIDFAKILTALPILLKVEFYLLVLMTLVK